MSPQNTIMHIPVDFLRNPPRSTSCRESSNPTSAPSPSSVRLNIAIVGAGIGGLSTAVALGRRGHSVTVYESAAKLAEIGAGIQVPPNSTRILRAWGMEHDLMKKAVQPDGILLRRWQDGRMVGHTRLTPEFPNWFGAPYVVIHRAHLHEVLHHHALIAGAEVKVASRVVDYNIEHPSCTLANGEIVNADLIIAADGVGSFARHKLLGDEDTGAERTGFAAYRALIDTADLAADPMTAHLVSSPNLQMWIGGNAHAMSYMIAGGKRFNIVISYPDDSDVATWDKGNVVDELKTRFTGWDPALAKMISMMKETGKWPLFAVTPLPRWVSDSGKFAILGDAAHAMVPYLALGAAMAVEDAAIMAECLHRIGSKEDLPKALSVYEVIRLKRTTLVREASLVNGTVLHYADGPEQEARDAAMRPEVEGQHFIESPNRWSDPATQLWCYFYDIEGEVESAWPA